jgi:uncharacterized protein YuzE
MSRDFHYDPTTDSLIDLGSDGEPVGYDIQHASQHPEFIAEALGRLHQRYAA